MITLNPYQNNLHQQALAVSRRHRQLESEIIEVLQKVDKTKLYRALEKPSLFCYVVEFLGFSESLAYAYITVSRKSSAIPELKEAIASQKLSISKAVRITSSMTAENAAEWIDFACHHSSREIEKEVARKNPKASSKDRSKPLSENTIQLTFTVTVEAFKKLKRSQSLRAQRNKSTSYGDILAELLDFYLERKDPVQKAERAEPCTRKATKEKSRPTNGRQPLTAAQRHAVFRRDGGCCAHVDVNGKRCGSDRWTEIHHIISVSKGGSNDLENLTTLCSFHHDLVHQLSLPIDGQVTWLRSPQRAYSFSVS